MNMDNTIYDIINEMSDVEKYEKIKHAKELLESQKYLMECIVKNYIGEHIPISIFVGDEGTSYTNHRSIIIKVSSEDALSMNDEELLRALRFLVGHECQHIKSTTRDIYTEAYRKAAEELKAEVLKTTKVVPVKAINWFVGVIFNGIEDGRIENIMCSNYPGLISYRNWYRIRGWKLARLTDVPIKDLLEDLFTIATMGIDSNSFLDAYKDNQSIMENRKKLIPFVAKATGSLSCRECMDNCYAIFKTLKPQIVECLLDDENIQEIEDKLKDFNEENFNEDESNEQQGSGSQVSVLTDNSSKSSAKNESEPEYEVDLRKEPPKANDDSSEDNSSEDNSSEGDSSEDGSTENGSSEDGSSESGSSEDSSSESGSSEGDLSEDGSSEGGSSEGGSSEDGSSEDGSSEDGASEDGSSEGDDSEEDITNTDTKSSTNSASEEKSINPERENGVSDCNEDECGEEDLSNSISENGEKTDGKKSTEEISDKSTVKEDDNTSNNDEISPIEQQNIEEGTEIPPQDKKTDYGALEEVINKAIQEALDNAIRESQQEVNSQKAVYEGLKQAVEEETALKLSKEDIQDALNRFGEGFRGFEEKAPSEYNKCYRLEKAPANIINRGVNSRGQIQNILESISTMDKEEVYDGEVDTDNLYKLCINEFDFFKQEGEPRELDMCLYILKDNSGSMSGQKEEDCCEQLAILEECFKGIVPMKIAGFVGNTHLIIKDWEQEDLNNNYTSSYHKYCYPSGGNYDALNIAIATKELEKRTEQQKLLIVLSDGQPNNSLADVRAAVEMAREKGIFVISIFFGYGNFAEENFEKYADMYGKYFIGTKPDNILSHLMRLLEIFIETT